MKHLSLMIALATLSLVACSRTPVANPDPNHTHADFAVWIDGKQLDFSGPEFMSGTSDENDPDHTKHDKYLHLHDGNGHVIHRHKPGLSIGQFFDSLGVIVVREGEKLCMIVPTLPMACENIATNRRWVMIVNGVRQSAFDLDYIFSDLDGILIALPTESDVARQQSEIQKYISEMTDTACLYSRTCPWRGDPPTENCIADPEVPCTGN